MRLSLVLLISIQAFHSFGQQSDIIEYESISINGVSWESTKTELIEVFGAPDTIFEPRFECDVFWSRFETVNSIELYCYPNIDCLVVDNQVELRDVYFDDSSEVELSFNLGRLSNETTIDELRELFPSSYENWLIDKYQIMRLRACELCDNEIWLHIEKKRIKRIQFWVPC